jgi:hypothetical protein
MADICGPNGKQGRPDIPDAPPGESDYDDNEYCPGNVADGGTRDRHEVKLPADLQFLKEFKLCPHCHHELAAIDSAERLERSFVEFPTPVPWDAEAPEPPPVQVPQRFKIVPAPVTPRADTGSVYDAVRAWVKELGFTNRLGVPLRSLLIAAGAKVANRYNSTAKLHLYRNQPYRYITHVTLVGSSGSGKGDTVVTFFEMTAGREVADEDLLDLTGATNAPETWRHDEFKGGTLQALYGGVKNKETSLAAERNRPGQLEILDDGWLSFPEATVLLDLGRRAGLLQPLIDFMSSGVMKKNTIIGGPVSYPSNCSLIFCFQTGVMAEVDLVIKGIGRRTIYAVVPPATEEERARENQEMNPQPNQSLLDEVRRRFYRLKTEYAPTKIDLAEVKEFIREVGRRSELFARDEQLVHSMAMGWTLVSLPPEKYKGVIKVEMTPSLRKIIEDAMMTSGNWVLDNDDLVANEILLFMRSPSFQAFAGRVGKKETMNRLARALSHKVADIRRVVDQMVKEGLLLQARAESPGKVGRPKEILRPAEVKP